MGNSVSPEAKYLRKFKVRFPLSLDSSHQSSSLSLDPLTLG